MASINGWIFILVGAVVAGVSYFMYDDLWAFIYVGAAFIAYGLIKALINRSRNKKDEKALEKEFSLQKMPQLNVAQKYLGKAPVQNSPHHNMGQQNINYQNAGYGVHNPNQVHAQQHMYNPAQFQHQGIPNQHVQPHAQANYAHRVHNPAPIICPSCGNGLRLHDNFCPHCGKRHH
jgi:hypothetical protein